MSTGLSYYPCAYADFDELVFLAKKLKEQKIYLERLYPYAEAGKLQLIRTYGQLLSEDYRADGIAVEAYVPPELFGQL